jgi:hypothetical protein
MFQVLGFFTALVLALPAAAQISAPSPALATWGEVLQPILPLVSVVLTVLVGWLTREIVNHTALKNNAILAGKVQDAATRAAGIAYNVIVAQASHINDQPVRNVALAQGVAYLNTMLPDTLKVLGVTPDKAAAMVEGELGKLLAADPNVAIPPVPAVPAPAG